MSVRNYIIIGALVLVALAGGIAAWMAVRPSVTPPASIAIVRFRATGSSELGEGLALSLAENLKSALTATGKTDVRDIQTASDDNPAATARSISAVAYLTGSVQSNGANVHASVSLVSVADKKTLWTGSFEGTVASWFPVEDRAAGEILSALWRELPIVQHHTADPEADQLYWRGRFAMEAGTRDALRSAGEFFQKAVEKDQADALAWAGLADASLLLTAYDSTTQHDLLPRVRAVALRAIKLDPTIAEPHTALGLVAENYDFDWDEAESELKRAADLNPSDALAHHWYGEFLVLMGKGDAGLAELKRAEHLEPLSPLIEAGYAKCLYLTRRYDDAIEKAKSALAVNPDSLPAHQWLAAAYFQKAMYKESTAESANLPVPATAVAQALSAAGEGDKEKAFGLLEQAFTDREPGILRLKTDPAFDVLRADPRFASLLGRLHLR